MKKKIITVILSIFTIFLLVSCFHDHTFEEEWTTDSVGHWHKSTCEHTDLLGEYGKHDFGSWEIVTEATEESEGLEHRICKVCGYEEAHTVSKKETHLHIFDSAWTSNEDYHWHKATCGHDVEGNKSLHSYGEVIIDAEPTESTLGKAHKVCSVCDYVYNFEIDKLVHEHTFEEEWSFNDLHHYHASTCEHDDAVTYERHTFGDWQIVDVPSATQDGLKYKVCSVCGYKYEEIIPKVNHEHTFDTAWDIDEYGHWHKSTCGHDVISKYALHDYGDDNKCKICGYEKTNDVLVDDSYVASFVWSSDYQSVSVTLTNKNDATDTVTKTFVSTVTKVDSTCTKAGCATYKVSMGYKGVLYEDTKVIDLVLKDHDLVFDGFDWEGFDCKARLICSVCGGIEHQDCTVEKISETESNCTEQGKVKFKVTYDNHIEEFEFDKELNPDNHVFGDEVNVPAIDTTPAHLEHTCTLCGYVETVDTGKDLETEGIYTGTYYSSITDVMLTDPDTLKATLNALINDGYKHYSYSDAQKQLRNIDSYDGYYVECIYTGERLGKTDAWDREHVWAKSYGFNDEAYYDAYTDMHHLRVSEHSINVNRSSSYFDIVSDPKYTDSYGNKWTTTVFEPRDEVKGDIARMLIYMTVKYDDPETLDLELTDDVNKINSTASTFGGYLPDISKKSEKDQATYNARKYLGGTEDPTNYLGMLSTLLKWHYEDPVDAREISRNNKIYEAQKNRNPFIDHPEYVYYLYRTESSQFIKSDSELSSYASYYKNFNKAAVDKIDAKIDALGTVSLDASFKAKLVEIDEDYLNLGKISKSFVTNYHKYLDVVEEYGRLYAKTHQDTTDATSFSFLNLSSKEGRKSFNGIDITYSGAGFHANYGIYATMSKSNAPTNATITATGLYSTIKYIKLTWSNNNTSGNATVEVKSSTTNMIVHVESLPFKKSASSVYVDITPLLVDGAYGDLSIVIRNDAAINASNSLRISDISFTLTK